MTTININGTTTVNGDGSSITTTGDVTVTGDNVVINANETLAIPEYDDARNLPLDGSVKLAWLIPLPGGSVNYVVSSTDHPDLNTNGSGFQRVLIAFSERESAPNVRAGVTYAVGWTAVQNPSSYPYHVAYINHNANNYNLAGLMSV